MTASTIPPQPRSSKPITILLVEDDEDLGCVIAESLSSRGQWVMIATNAEDALTLLHGVGLLVLVTDFSIPGGDGVSLIQHVRSDPRLAHLAMVLATGHADGARLEGLAAALGAAFVSKPFDLDGLLAAVDRAKSMMPPPAARAA